MKRLGRAQTRTAQIWRTSGLAIILAMIAAPLGVFGSRESWMFAAIATAFGLASLLLFYSAVYQLLALRTPETIVETDKDEWKRGANVALRFQQPGSGSFESLRANLVGEERWRERVRGGKYARRVAQLGTFHLFDSGAFEAPFDKSVTVRVPPDLPRASKPDRREVWRLEVWGKVKGRADVQHVFPVTII